MMKTPERFFAEWVDRYVRAHAFGTTRLARALGVSPRTVDRWAAGECLPDDPVIVIRVLHAVAQGDPAHAVSMAAGLLPASKVEAVEPGAMLGETCDVIDSAAELQHTVREATSDGRVTPLEDAAIRTAALRVQREAADVPAAFASASPQMVMGAVR